MGKPSQGKEAVLRNTEADRVSLVVSGLSFLQLPGEGMWKKQSEDSHLSPYLYISQYMLQSMGA